MGMKPTAAALAAVALLLPASSAAAGRLPWLSTARAERAIAQPQTTLTGCRREYRNVVVCVQSWEGLWEEPEPGSGNHGEALMYAVLCGRHVTVWPDVLPEGGCREIRELERHPPHISKPITVRVP